MQQDLNTDKRIPGLKTLHCLKSTLEAQSSIIQVEKIDRGSENRNGPTKGYQNQ